MPHKTDDEHENGTCGRHIIDTAYVCAVCSNRVANRLNDTAELYAEMTIAIARLARFGDPVRFSVGERPLPYNLDASRGAATVDNTITTWARHIANERGLPGPHRGTNIMHWLARQCDWLRYRQEAAEALDELDYAARLIMQVIDSPTPYWYAGRCDNCGEGLYARTGAETVNCRTEGCYATYGAKDRKAWLLDYANDSLATAAEIARFVSAMRGEMVTASMIRGLAHRGRIIPHGVVNRAPTYRVGDVIAILVDGRIVV